MFNKLIWALTGLMVLSYGIASAETGTHKGATYPLTDTYISDCSLYIDPKEAETYSHCEEINENHIKKFSEPYLRALDARWKETLKEHRNLMGDEPILHKGATYPTTNIFLPDCSLYIDPKDSAMYSHCEKPVKFIPRRWLGYFEMMGKPGTARSMGQSDLFVSLLGSDKDLTFLNTRGKVDFGNDAHEYSLGLGHRHLFDNWIIGAYGYYDLDFTEAGNEFNSWTLGVEALSENWDFRANAYLSRGNSRTVVPATTKMVIDENQQMTVALSKGTTESMPSGFDVEIGYKLPIPKLTDSGLLEDTRLYLGGYHYGVPSEYESVTGPRIRFETRLHDLPMLGNGSRLMLGVETQYDEARKSQTFGMVSLRIPFGVGTHAPVEKGLGRRMLEPVVRDGDVVTYETKNAFATVDRLYSLYGEEYDRYVEVGTQQEFEDLLAEVSAEGYSKVVFANLGGNATEKQTWTFTSEDTNTAALIIPAANITLSMAGEGAPLNFFNPITGKEGIGWVAPSGIAPKMNFNPALDANGELSYQTSVAVNVLDGVHLNGWDIDGSWFQGGVSVGHTNTSSTVTITNSVVRHTGHEYLKAQATQGLLGYTNDYANIKIHAGGNKLFVDRVTLYGTRQGILIDDHGKLFGVPGTSGRIGNSGMTQAGDCEKVYARKCNSVVAFTHFDSSVTEDGEAYDILGEINGVTIDGTGYFTGIKGDRTHGNYVIKNTLVQNAGTGLQAQGSGSSGTQIFFDVSNSEFSNNSLGISVAGGVEVRASGVRVVNNTWTGIRVVGGKNQKCIVGIGCTVGEDFFKPSTLYISSSTVSNNWRGVWARNGGYIFATGLSVTGNTGYGVVSSGSSAVSGSYFEISNSDLSGNGQAGAASDDATLLYK